MTRLFSPVSMWLFFFFLVFLSTSLFYKLSAVAFIYIGGYTFFWEASPFSRASFLKGNKSFLAKVFAVFFSYLFFLIFFSYDIFLSFQKFLLLASTCAGTFWLHYWIKNSCLVNEDKIYFFIIFFAFCLTALGLEAFFYPSFLLRAINFLSSQHHTFACLKPGAAMLSIAAFPILSFCKKSGYSWLGHILLGILFTVCWLAKAQSASIAVILGGISYYSFFLFPRFSSFVATGGSFALIMGMPFIKYFFLKTQIWKNLLESNFHTLYQRFLIWDFTVDKIWEKPWKGWGLGVSKIIPGGQVEILQGLSALQVHPHNNSLELWLELGVGGAFAGALLIAWLFWRLQNIKNVLYVSSWGGFLVSTLVICFTSYGVWHMWWICWVSLISLLPYFLSKPNVNA